MRGGTMTTTIDSPQQPSKETVHFIFEATKDAVERQMRDFEAFDTKMVQIFAAASVIIGLAGFGRATVAGGWLVTLLLFGAVLAYLGTAFLAFQHLQPKTVKRVPLSDLWETHWRREPAQIEYALVEAINEAAVENRPVLDAKASRIRWAVLTTATEVGCVGLAVIASLVA